MEKLFTKMGVAFGTSVVITEAVNLQPLWNALITLAVSVLTVLTVEGVAWLRAWLNNKRVKEEKEEESYKKKCEEADEIVEIAESEKED